MQTISEADLRKSRWGLAWLGGVLLLLGVGGVATYLDDGRDGGSPMTAFEMAKVFVERELRSPGSAKFGPYRQNVVERVNSSTWRVRSWVDSQNGFGALLRANYTCTLRYAGKDRWTLESLDLR